MSRNTQPQKRKSTNNTTLSELSSEDNRSIENHSSYDQSSINNQSLTKQKLRRTEWTDEDLLLINKVTSKNQFFKNGFFCYIYM